MTTTTVSLSPAESVLARQISYWINISAEGKGGSKDQLGRGWTYLSAEDLQGRVLDYDSVDLSVPTIYRALRSLVTKGWFLREKLTSHRWYQVFHYTFGPNHPSQNLKNGTDQIDQLEGIKAEGSQLSNPSGSSTSKTNKPIDIRREEQTNSQGSATPHEQPSASPIDKEERQFIPAPTLCIEMYNSGELTERVGFEPTVSSNKREGFEPSIASPLTAIADAAPSALLEQLRGIEENYRSRLKELESPVEDCSAEVVENLHGMQRVSDKEPVVALDAGSNERPPLPQSDALPARRAHNPKVGTGNVWDRIRALASQFEPSQVEAVSPSSVITKKGQRYRVDDGVTAPLR